LVIRYFAAIEAGDMSAFRSLLMAQDGVDANHQIGLVLHYFGDLLEVELDLHTAWEDNEIRERIRLEEFSPRPRNTGLSVREIIDRDDWSWGVVARVADNEGNETFHTIRFYYMGWEGRGFGVNEHRNHGEDNPISIVGFTTLPGGTRVDTRVDRRTADVILRHFAAIEDGDVAAFRQTLMAQDGADRAYHSALIFRYFGDMFETEEMTGDLWEEQTMELLGREIPPMTRDFELFVSEIRLTSRWPGLIAIVIKDEGEETVYGIAPIEDYFYGEVFISATTIIYDYN